MSIIEQKFPNLSQTPYKITSPLDPNYNCIAWAADENDCWWWPDPQCYWPKDVPHECNLEAFIQAYGTRGYVPCEDDGYEAEFEKAAIYVDCNGTPTHAARQLSAGIWTSKLGQAYDIQHTLAGLEGTEYGTVARILKRAR